jgi:hypothetical protein
MEHIEQDAIDLAFYVSIVLKMWGCSKKDLKPTHDIDVL